jgi:hypothetical protein
MNAEDLKGMNGRKVLVEGVIHSVHLDCAVVTFAPYFKAETPCITVSHSAIREILPAEIKVGDVVRTLSGARAVVKAMTDAAALVQFSDGQYSGFTLFNLTLIEPAQ